jgi:lipoyl(octanoyl) transferase
LIAIVKKFQQADFVPLAQKMRTFTDQRNPETPDEFWIVEHLPVYTLGQAGKPEHILNPSNIPIVKTDRGGQVTYHGPGQLVIYTLLDLKRKNMGVRQLVTHLETCMIDLLKEYHLDAVARCDAPGVYINEAKIGSIGLRIRQNCAYHGLALNINMDLSPFLGINPCGHKGLKVTQLKDFGIETHPFEIAPRLVDLLNRV